jgi:hypothetical protein
MHETYFPESTAIRSAAYEEETQELTVVLTTGRTYVYREVEDWVYDELRAAESAGRYYNQRIKDLYPYYEVLVRERFALGALRSFARPPAPRRIDPSRGSRARRLQSRRARRG